MKIFLAVCVLALTPAALSERVFAERGDTRVEWAQPDEIPELTAPVNDFAGVIDAASKNQIDALVRKLKDATGDVMIIATIKTFKPYADLPSYTLRMFENHGKGIGAKGNDNGVLIVLAVDDRAVRIEPGYGLEGFITDGFSGATSRAMVPYFKNGEYGAGLVEGATNVAERIAQGRNVNLADGTARPANARRRTGRLPIGFWIVLFIIVMSMRKRRRRGRWISGVGPFG
ncbi:MAG TPA: TPM domain-containing protein, partial [Vicinamibacterales bacterium]|nr:TPM domain-containing protein [Vicinamibacterales bacterium]